MPDGSGGGGEGAGGGSQGMGGLGGGNGGNNGMGANAAPPGGPPSGDSGNSSATGGPPSGDSGDSSATGVRDTDSGLSAVSPFAAFTSGFQTTPKNQQALNNQETVRSFLAQVAQDKQTALNKPGEFGNLSNPNIGTNVSNALAAALASGINTQNFTRIGKNGEEKNIESKTTNIPIASFLGYTGDPNNSAISYGEAKMLQALKAGDLAGVNLNNMTATGLTIPGTNIGYSTIGQDANSVVAATDAERVISRVLDVAKNFIPGYGLATFAANLLSGKMTIGQAIASVAGDRVASLLGISPAMFQAALNGNYGDGLAGWATNALNSYVAKETKTDPRLTATVLGTIGLPSLAKTSLSSLNVGPSISGAAAKAVDSGLKSIGIGNGPATTSSNAPSLGMDTQSQVDNILNSGSAGSSSAPSSAPAATGNISSAGPSSESYAGALSSMANSGSPGGTYRIGNSNYTPYSQDLAQLNLAPDEFTKQSDIGNIPVYNTDIAKMASSPFTQASDPYSQYAAAGGSIRHFDEGGDVAPAPTADQLEKRAALQAQAEYYKNLDSEKQNADIMTALKNLSGVGAAEAKPQSSPLIRLGQVGQYTPPKVLPQLAALLQARGMRLAEGGQPDDHSHPNYDGTPVFRTGGLSGLGGKYVEGKGDGTSDDITAMLADGEYVFSADVVSALGNGSNKAGAQVLDKTVEAIRSRARSAPPSKLPPDAKSPLEYMQSVKGKKYG